MFNDNVILIFAFFIINVSPGESSCSLCALLVCCQYYYRFNTSEINMKFAGPSVLLCVRSLCTRQTKDTNRSKNSMKLICYSREPYDKRKMYQKLLQDNLPLVRHSEQNVKWCKVLIVQMNREN